MSLSIQSNVKRCIHSTHMMINDKNAEESHGNIYAAIGWKADQYQEKDDT